MEIKQKKIKQKVVMFVGKGGVGKTTISAATAMHFALQGNKTLIISTDPAPSLSDIFEVHIGNKETKITENLYAIEISFDEVLRRWKEKFGDEIYEVISSFIKVDYNIVDYIGSAPGIDEEFMLEYIYEIFMEGKYERIIWDTAPVGHTLRLLKFPEKFIGHLEDALKIYMHMFNYVEAIKGIAKGKKRSVFQIINGWIDLSNKIYNFMRNSDNVCYVAVTVPEALIVYQTRRIIEEFKNFGLNISFVVINNIIVDSDCVFHRKRKEVQKKYIDEIKKISDENISGLIEVPLFLDEVKGIKKLKKVEEILFKPDKVFKSDKAQYNKF